MSHCSKPSNGFPTHSKVPDRSNALPSACLCSGCIANTWPQARDSTAVGSPTSKPTLLRNHVSGQKNPSQDGPSALSEWSAAASFLLQPQRASRFSHEAKRPSRRGLCPLVLTQVFLSQRDPPGCSALQPFLSSPRTPHRPSSLFPTAFITI